MKIGNLDRRIVIERYSETRDAFNNVVEAWTTLTTVWAAVSYPATGRRGEMMTAQEIQAEQMIQFRIRYSTTVSSLNPKDRISYNGKTYDISAVSEVGRHEGLDVIAVARAD